MKKAIYSDNGRISDICEPGQEFSIHESLEWIDVADDTTEMDTWDGTQVVKHVPHVPDYAELRQGAYPFMGDQLDAIWKISKALKDADIDIGVDGEAMLTQILAVKTTHPKPK